MNSTTKDLRYLKDKKFIEYAFLALGDHFISRDEFLDYFNHIKVDNRQSLFLRTASFYLCLVKRGDWTIDVPGSDNVIDYLTNTYKYVAIFSLIESLSKDRFIDFYQFLVRRKSGVKLPISDRARLDELYEKYKAEFGAIQRCISFFRMLSPNRQRDLISRLNVRGTAASIENLAKYLYELRSKFVHEAELVHHMSEGKSISWKDGNLVVCTLSIKDAMTFFEEGLIENFRETET